MRAGIAGVFVVLGANDDGSRVVKFCAERGLYVGNTYFEDRSLHKYTRVARGQDGVKVKIMLDLVLVNKDMLRYVQDVRLVNGTKSLRSHCIESGWWRHGLRGEI